jgi:hypothetical protein
MPPALDQVTAPPAPAGRAGAGVGREAALRRLAILVALYALPALALVQPVLDADLWWHLRTGQWIVEHGAVPTTDPFSQAGRGRSWVAYSWLFEVLVYRLHEWLGLSGILFGRVALGLAIAVLVHRMVARRERHFPAAALLAGLALVALSLLFRDRSWMFSILFYVLTLGAVLRQRAGPAPPGVWLLPLAFALWANLHVEFVVGLALLGLACAAPLIDRALGRRGPDGHAATAFTPEWWRLVLLTAACAAATLVNPYHAGLYRVVLELPTQAGAYALLPELQALAFREPWDWAVLALLALAAFALGRRGRLDTFEVLLLAGSAYLSFRARRDLWCVVLASLAVAVGRPRPEGPADEFPLTAPRLLAAAAGVTLLFAALAWKYPTDEASLQSYVAGSYPAAAAAVVEERNYPGPLYNSYAWGGYLIWRLPGLPVSIDGRANLHGDARMKRAFATYEARPGWDEDPDLRAARLVVLEREAPLASVLRLDRDNFTVAYEDEVSVVFVRGRTPAGGDKRSPSP